MSRRPRDNGLPLAERVGQAIAFCRLSTCQASVRHRPRKAMVCPPAALSEGGRHKARTARCNRNLVFSRDVQVVELVQQTGALAQDYGSRPFHKFTHFGKPGGGETSDRKSTRLNSSHANI